MLFLLLIVASILWVLYLKIKYFTLRGPLPGLSPHFFFGNIIQSGILFDNLSLHQVYLAFKNRFGDIYQFWMGPWRLIIVSGITDVQHIFTYRNIYDQGDIFVEQLHVLMHDGLICLKGQLHFFSLTNMYVYLKVPSGNDTPSSPSPCFVVIRSPRISI
jgi:hypothetical protein